MTAATALLESNPDVAASEIEIDQAAAALVYDEGTYSDKIMKHVVGHCRMRGIRLAIERAQHLPYLFWQQLDTSYFSVKL